MFKRSIAFIFLLMIALKATADCNYKIFSPCLIDLAKNGDTEANYQLSLFYSTGVGVKENPEMGVKYMATAAILGHPEAQFQIGLVYTAGDSKDYLESAKWFQLAAEQGVVAAQYNAGVMFSLGQGVKQDYLQAISGLSSLLDTA